jgi:hypothetical protein
MTLLLAALICRSEPLSSLVERGRGKGREPGEYTSAPKVQAAIKPRTLLPGTIRFPAEEAIQGVAVDKEAFYAINNYAIGKYDKRTGKKLAEWKGEKGGPIIHLDGGAVVRGKLYCPHSNFSQTPMISSIEVWDCKTLKHVQSYPMGYTPGAANWIDWHDNAWWVGFANYNGTGGVPGRGNEFSYVACYDKEFRQLGEYTFPKSMVETWEGMSISGAVWLSNNTILMAPHTEPELYVARLPKMGSVLEFVKTIPVENEGQGIALDPDGKTIWAIQRRTREVLAYRLP